LHSDYIRIILIVIRPTISACGSLSSFLVPSMAWYFFQWFLVSLVALDSLTRYLSRLKVMHISLTVHLLRRQTRSGCPMPFAMTMNMRKSHGSHEVALLTSITQSLPGRRRFHSQ
jgi:hypothetical protein